MPTDIFINKVQIENYKGFDAISFSSSHKVNLITGKNNVGKTNLLEAIFLALGPNNPSLWLNVCDRRGFTRIGRETPASYLFPNLDFDQNIKIKIFPSGSPVSTLTIKYLENAKISLNIDGNSIIREGSALNFLYRQGKNVSIDTRAVMTGDGVLYDGDRKQQFADSIFLSTYISPSTKNTVERFSDLIKDNRDEEIREALSVIDKRIRRMAIILEHDEPFIAADIGFGMMPITNLGGGLYRLTTILTSIAYARNGVCLIDEVESSFHHSVLHKVWEAIIQFADKVNCQIFATTHSQECLASAYSVFSKRDTYDLGLHRVVRQKEKLQIYSLNKDEFDAALQSGWELR